MKLEDVAVVVIRRLRRCSWVERRQTPKTEKQVARCLRTGRRQVGDSLYVHDERQVKIVLVLVRPQRAKCERRFRAAGVERMANCALPARIVKGRFGIRKHAWCAAP